MLTESASVGTLNTFCVMPLLRYLNFNRRSLKGPKPNFLYRKIHCASEGRAISFEALLTYIKSEEGSWVATLNTFKKSYILINNANYKEMQKI